MNLIESRSVSGWAVKGYDKIRDLASSRSDLHIACRLVNSLGSTFLDPVDLTWLTEGGTIGTKFELFYIAESPRHSVAELHRSLACIMPPHSPRVFPKIRTLSSLLSPSLAHERGSRVFAVFSISAQGCSRSSFDLLAPVYALCSALRNCRAT